MKGNNAFIKSITEIRNESRLAKPLPIKSNDMTCACNPPFSFLLYNNYEAGMEREGCYIPAVSNIEPLL